MNLGGACSLQPPQPGAPLLEAECQGLRGSGVHWRVITLAPTPHPGACPARRLLAPQGIRSPFPGPSPACLCSASSGQLGPESRLPAVCLPPSRPLMPPAHPGVPAACTLPARCLPVACPSCPHAGFWKEPNSPPGLAPGGAVPPGSPHPSLGSCPCLVGPSSAGQAGRLTDEPAGQRAALPDPETECWARQLEA